MQTALAWVLMPDHLHLMLTLGAIEALSQSMARAKARIWHQLRRVSGSSLQLWQSSYHDHALRRDEDLLLAGRYLLTNPVRAGLVECYLDWKWRGGSLLAAIEAEWPRVGPSADDALLWERIYSAIRCCRSGFIPRSGDPEEPIAE